MSALIGPAAASLLLAVAIALAVPAPRAVAQADLLGIGPAPATAPDPGPIAVGEAAPTDAAITERLSAIFAAIEALSDVEARATAGVVVLDGTTSDLAAAREAVALARRVEGVVTVIDRIERGAAVERSVAPWIERLERRLADAVRLLPLAAVGLAVFALFALMGWLVGRWRGLFAWLAPNRFVAALAAQAVRTLFLLAGLVVALDLVGATALLGAILGAAGILGLAIGFAVRDTIENYVASVLLSVRQPFAPNDFVDIDGHEGFVVRLTARATVLLTLAGNHVRLPNATVFKSRIVNYTQTPERRFDFALGVNADASLAEALALGRDTLGALDFALADPAPAAWIEEVGDSSVVLRFAAWVDQSATDYLQARSEAIRLVKRALEGAGFELPEPIYRVHLRETAASAPCPPAEPAEPAGTARHDTLERRVAEARDGEGDDLLDERAPRE
ncbi:MAG: mechanosensitive ion channel family protein [Paracoccaceae bacterium]